MPGEAGTCRLTRELPEQTAEEPAVVVLVVSVVVPPLAVVPVCESVSSDPVVTSVAVEWEAGQVVESVAGSELESSSQTVAVRTT